MGPFRAVGFVAVTVPAVALAHGVVSGVLPSAAVLVMVALAALLIGWLARDAPPRPLVLALAGAQLFGHAVVYFAPGGSTTGCLPALGRGARVGLDMALLRPAAECGPGGYAVDVGALAALAAILLALSLVAGQLLVAVVGAVALRVVEASWAAAVALARWVLPTLVERASPTPTLSSFPAPLLRAQMPSPQSRPLLRRGPPVALAH